MLSRSMVHALRWLTGAMLLNIISAVGMVGQVNDVIACDHPCLADVFSCAWRGIPFCPGVFFFNSTNPFVFLRRLRVVLVVEEEEEEEEGEMKALG